MTGNPLGQRALSSQGNGTRFKQMPVRLSHTHEIDFSGTGGSSNVIPTQSMYDAPFINGMMDNGKIRWNLLTFVRQAKLAKQSENFHPEPDGCIRRTGQ